VALWPGERKPPEAQLPSRAEAGGERSPLTCEGGET
jgi:hypothetical protein